MIVFPQPCLALPQSPKLRAKQARAKSAKRERFSAFSFLKFQIPRVSASRNRGAHFAFPNRILPFRPASAPRTCPDPVGALVGALRPWREPACPGNAGREISGFTLIELMAATTVLSIILLMMVGMQDQMSKAWSNSNRRTDATREARAACRLMASDLSCLIYRGQDDENKDSMAPILNNQGIPFYFSSNGLGSPFSIAGVQSNASLLFAISRVKPQGTSPEDFAIVGYYIASKLTTNVSGFATTNYNLYRHYVPASKAVSNLITWFATATNNRTANLLFKPDPATDDILARNTCNLRITFYNRPDGNYSPKRPNKVQNGLNYQCPSGGSTTYYSGSKIQAEISVYPDELAQKIPYTSWMNSTNIQKFARSYEFRVDVPRN
jgi:prepilin-type N-terminal cleavage/methylation domain-containing protein